MIADIIRLGQKQHEDWTEMRYSIRFLLYLIAIMAMLAFCIANLSQTTYLFACVIIPATVALICRYAQNCQHGLASLLALGSATVIGSVLLAYGSYDQTFNNGATGILVGDGWNSVVASTIAGGCVGAFCGLFAILIYFLFSALIGNPLRSGSDQTSA